MKSLTLKRDLNRLGNFLFDLSLTIGFFALVWLALWVSAN